LAADLAQRLVLVRRLDPLGDHRHVEGGRECQHGSQKCGVTRVVAQAGELAGPYVAGLRQQGEALLARVFDVIDERYQEPVSTADIAVAVGLSPGYLTTLVRRRTGRAVLDWILERRMAAARQLLLSTDLSAEAIAGRVGFTDPSYFNRRFRAYHGLSPGRWRSSALAGALTPVPESGP